MASAEMEGVQAQQQDGEEHVQPSQQSPQEPFQVPSSHPPVVHGKDDAQAAQQRSPQHLQQDAGTEQNATASSQVSQPPAQQESQATADLAPVTAAPSQLQTYEAFVFKQQVVPVPHLPTPAPRGRHPPKRTARIRPVTTYELAPRPQTYKQMPPQPHSQTQQQPPPPMMPPPTPHTQGAPVRSPSAMGFPTPPNPGTQQQMEPPSSVAGLRTVIDGLTVESCTKLLSEMTDAQRRDMLYVYAEARPGYGNFLKMGFNQNIAIQNTKIMFFDDMVDGVTRGIRARCARDDTLFDPRSPNSFPAAMELFDRLIEPTIRMISANALAPAKEETRKNAMIAILAIVEQIADTPLFKVEPGLGFLRDRPILEAALFRVVSSTSPDAWSRMFTAQYTRPGSVATITVRDMLKNCIGKCDAIGAMPRLRQIFTQLGGDPTSVARPVPLGSYGPQDASQPSSRTDDQPGSVPAQPTSQANNPIVSHTSATGAALGRKSMGGDLADGLYTPDVQSQAQDFTSVAGENHCPPAPTINPVDSVTDIALLNDDQIDDITPGPVEKFDNQVSQIEIDYYSKYAQDPTATSGYAIAATIEDAWGYIGKRSTPGTSYATRRNAAFAYVWIIAAVAQAGGSLEERVRKEFGPSAVECVAVFQELVDGLRPSERRKLMGEKSNGGSFVQRFENVVKQAQGFGVFEGLEKCLESLRRV